MHSIEFYSNILVKIKFQQYYSLPKCVERGKKTHTLLLRALNRSSCRSLKFDFQGVRTIQRIIICKVRAQVSVGIAA